MLLIVDYPFPYTIIDREFFETLERLEPNRDDFIAPISKRLPASWTMKTKSIWCFCEPSASAMITQGWKIHVSGTSANATTIIAIATDILVEHGTPFKFAADLRVLHMLNSKRWSRGAGGKLMTVYPRDEQTCGRLLEALHQRTLGFKGPVILSDRQYRDGSLVHYRYGGFAATRRLTVEGRRVPVITAADGEAVPDERTAFFNPPEGVADPFQPPTSPANDDYPDGTLKAGRYKVERALVFSNAGGVYVATDTTTGTQVLIKEARPFVGQTKFGDAVLLLKKEERLLRTLGPTGVVPRLLDFFVDWNHCFLVEEFIEGRTLRGHNAGNAVLLRTRPTREHLKAFLDQFCSLYTKIARAMHAIHERGVVLVDVSHYNVMVSPDGERVWFIDFDGAYEPGVDVPSFLQTPGFGSSDDATRPRDALDDWYGFGSLMLASLLPINDIMAISREAFRPFLAAWLRDLGLPPRIGRCIARLLDLDRAERPAFEEIVTALEPSDEINAPQATTHEIEEADTSQLLTDIAQYIRSKMSLDRDDRLVPASAEVFETNPLSVAFGACGVAHALSRIEGRTSPEIVEWILRHKVSAETYPPGLYTGMTGVAWTLLDLGYREDAERIISMTFDHPQLWDSPDLFHGVAGWGMGLLRFFLATGDERYLATARRAGEFLERARIRDAGSSHWQNGPRIFCGLGHGSAGIGLFLLYLSLATGDTRFAGVGQEAIAHVLTSALENPDGGFTWLVDEKHVTRTPYWRWGSAGIGISLLRYAMVLSDPEYEDALERLHIDTDRKYAIFPGHQTGLAGIGDFYLDWRMFRPNDDRAIESAKRVTSGVLLFKLPREGGIAFPGETRTHISCDYLTGSAGIGAFIHRLVYGGATAFMLDALIPESRRAIPALPGSDFTRMGGATVLTGV